MNETSNLKQRTALVMDPSGTVRSQLSDALRALGHRVMEHASSGDAMASINGHDIGVAVIDHMPGDLEVESLVQSLLIDTADVERRVVLLGSDSRPERWAADSRLVCIPKIEDASVLIAQALESPASDPVATGSPQASRILVVDDSATFRASMQDLFDGRHRIIEAATGREALAALTREPVDAVLLDHGLPDMLGIDVCRAIRAEACFQTLPVIMLTAAEDEAVIIDAFRSGADDYVVKGCRNEVLLARVGAHLRRHHTERLARKTQLELRAAETEAETRGKMLTLLNQQAEELRRANEDLDRFAAMAAHDLQAPLRGVRSFLELAHLRGSLDERTARYVDQAAISAKRMSALVEGLLHYARAGWSDISRDVPCDADQIAREAVATHAQQIGELSATVTVAPLPSVHFDPVCLRQIFENLIGNALKYRSQRAPEIRIAASGDERRVRFTVSDNGQGIEERHRQRVFGMFERLHGQEVPGVGIGLAVCMKIIVARKQQMGVESEVGQGSTFWFTASGA